MIIKCNNCGKEFKRVKSAIEKNVNNFCSNRCAGEFKRMGLIDQVFDRLTVLKFVGMSNGKSVFECKCSCGRVVKVGGYVLKRGQASCKNCRSRKYIGKISGKFFTRIRKQAESRGITFEITQEYIWDLYQKQNGKCSYSNLDIDFADTAEEQDHGATTASLDRKDSKIGYIKENIHWIHKDINWMKNRFNEEYFLGLCKAIANHQDRKGN